MPTDPADDIERFAELSALLDDPFANEAEVLSASGLDARTWGELEARWFIRLQEGDAADLAARYGKAYRLTRERIACGTALSTDAGIPSTKPDTPRFLNADAQPWRAEAAAVGRDLSDTPPPLEPAPPPESESVERTLECAQPLPRPVMPFQPPDDGDSPDATLPLGAVLPRPALPFTPR